MRLSSWSRNWTSNRSPLDTCSTPPPPPGRRFRRPFLFAPFFLDGFCVHFFVKKWGTLCSLDVAIGAIQVLCAPFFAPRRQKTCLSRGPRPRPAQSALAWHRLLLLLVVVVVCFSSAPSTAMPPKEKSALGGLLTRPKNAPFFEMCRKKSGKECLPLLRGPRTGTYRHCRREKKSVAHCRQRAHFWRQSPFCGLTGKKTGPAIQGTTTKKRPHEKKGGSIWPTFFGLCRRDFLSGSFFHLLFFPFFFFEVLILHRPFLFSTFEKREGKEQCGKKTTSKRRGARNLDEAHNKTRGPLFTRTRLCRRWHGKRPTESHSEPPCGQKRRRAPRRGPRAKRQCRPRRAWHRALWAAVGLVPGA